MEKITNKELKKLSKEVYSSASIINELPDVHNTEVVKKALLEMFEKGYRYGEYANIKNIS